MVRNKMLKNELKSVERQLAVLRMGGVGSADLSDLLDRRNRLYDLLVEYEAEIKKDGTPGEAGEVEQMARVIGSIGEFCLPLDVPTFIRISEVFQDIAKQKGGRAIIMPTINPMRLEVYFDKGE